MKTPHVLERAKERYGLELTYRDIANAEKRIRRGQAKYLGSKNGAEYYSLIIAGQLVKVACDKRRKFIKTFLPWGMEGTSFAHLQPTRASTKQYVEIETIRGPWFSFGFHIDFQNKHIDIHFIWWIVTLYAYPKTAY